MAAALQVSRALNDSLFLQTHRDSSSTMASEVNVRPRPLMQHEREEEDVLSEANCSWSAERIASFLQSELSVGSNSWKQLLQGAMLQERPERDVTELDDLGCFPRLLSCDGIYFKGEKRKCSESTNIVLISGALL